VGKKSVNIYVSYLWERNREIFLFPTSGKEVGKYLYLLPVGKNSGNIYVSYLCRRSQEIFMFPTCGKEVGKYFCFLPVGKSQEIFPFPTCGEEAFEDFLLRKGERRSNDFRWFPGDPWKILS
jgi:hypothetical protein